MILTEVEHLKGGLEGKEGFIVNHVEVVVDQVNFLEG